MKDDSALKVILVSVAAIFVLWIGKLLLFPAGYTMGVTVRGNFRGEHMSGNYYYGNGASLEGMMTFLIKVLFVIVIVGLIIAVIKYIKSNLFTREDIEAIRGEFTGKKFATKKVCSECNKEINTEWVACPYCGKELTRSDDN